jgi:hypothetical protein
MIAHIGLLHGEMGHRNLPFNIIAKKDAYKSGISYDVLKVIELHSDISSTNQNGI